MMYRHMSPKDLEKLILENRKLKEQQLSKKDFEKAKNALEAANIPPPYKAVVAPILDRP